MRRRSAMALIAVCPLAALFVPGVAAHAAWSTAPWVTLSAGYENDRLRDPALDRFTLPGGGLVGLTPGIRTRGLLGERVRLDLSGEAACEGFGNSAGRTVLGAAVDADLRVQVARSWVWRTTVAGSRYSDSAYETANRIGGGIETGFGLAGPRGSLGLIGAADARRYDNVVVTDATGASGAYTETGASAGLDGSARVGTAGLFSARALWQRTEARDPLYDADSWLAQAAARVEIASGTFLTLSALGQLRRFALRPMGEDEDSYWQVGAGVDRRVVGALRAAARYAFGRITDPLGARENLHRATLALTWGLGEPLRVEGLSGLRLPSAPTATPLRENDVRVFRCEAPGARQVSLVGDFNGWDPTAHPLQPAEDGWWQVELRLAGGSHLYAYVVDGRTVAPADAESTVDDGFGGRDGLIWVQPAEP